LYSKGESMRNYNILTLIIMLMLTTTIPVGASELDWPTLRQNQDRTGHSDGVGQINLPIVKWQYYLGGSLREKNVWFGDVDSNGSKEIAMTIGGRVVLKNDADQVLWRTGLLAASEIVGLYDIDNNGTNELVVTSGGPPSSLIILNATNGNILWNFQNFDPKTNSFPKRQVMVHDLDGDGLLDIVAKPNEAYLYTYAFTFKNGFSSNPEDNVFWTYKHRLYGNETPYLIGDVDNDNKNEVVFIEYQRITILDAETGLADQEVYDVFESHPFGAMYLKNVDDDPQPEIISVSYKNAYDYQITVFDAVDKSVSWQIQWHPTLDKSMVSAEHSVIDLDNDGSVEIVVSVYNDIDDEKTFVGSMPSDYDGVFAPDQWSLLIFDAATGQLKADMQDVYLEGVKDFNLDGVPEIVVKKALPGFVTVEAFADIQAFNLKDGQLEKQWEIANANMVRLAADISSDFNYNHNNPTARIGTADLNGDKDDELLLFLDTDNNNEIDTLRAYDVSETVPQAVASMSISSSNRLSLLKAGGKYANTGGKYANNGDGEQLAVFRYAGYVQILDNEFSEIASLTTGNYRTNPIAVDLDDDGVVEILVKGSDGILKVLDSSMANIAEQPEIEWSFLDWFSPNLSAWDLDNDGLYELPVFDLNDRQNPLLHMLNYDGSVLWSREFTGYGSIPEQLGFGSFNSNEVDDFMLVIKDYSRQAAEEHRIITLDGRNGNEIWNRPTISIRSSNEPLFVVDLDYNGYDDLINTDAIQIEYYDGLDGSLMYDVPRGYWPINNILADFNLDGTKDLLLNSRDKNLGLQLFDLLADLPSWTLPHSNSYEVATYPGVFSMEGERGIIKPTTFGSLQAYDSDGIAIWAKPIFLRDGNVLYSDPGDSMTIEGVTVADINNDGFEDALVGTDDGWLVAIQIDNHSRLWSLNIGSTVYEPLVADVDMDGLLEVIVVAGDGNMYLIDNQNLDAPQNVLDVPLNADFEILNSNIDIDETGFAGGLAASWDAVLGAAGYKYTILDEHSTPIVAWMDSRGDTEAIVEFPLIVGKTYRFAVQAYAPLGLASAVVLTDGVTIIEDQPPVISNASVSPVIFNPQTTLAQISALFTDSNSLKSYEVKVVSSVTNQVFRNYSDAITGSSYALALQWDGRDGLGEFVNDGEYRIEIYLEDTHFNMVSTELSVRVDSTKPEKPEITSPTDDEVVEYATVPVIGLAEENSFVEIELLNNPQFNCSTYADENGDFSCELIDLPDGSYKLKAYATDSAGNRSAPSKLVKIIVDTSLNADGDVDQELEEDAEVDADQDGEEDENPIACNSNGNFSAGFMALLLSLGFVTILRRRKLS